MRRVLAALLVVALLLPVALLLSLSFSRQWTWPALLPAQWQLRLWRDLLADTAGIGSAIGHSLLMAVGVGSVATVLGFPTSRRVAQHRRRGRLLALIHLPYALSPVVLGVSLLYVFLKWHLAGHLVGVMLAQLIFAYAYAVILLSGFWNPRTAALVDLAHTLGAERTQVWRRVLIPMAMPMLLICLFQTFLISWFDYPLALLIGGGQVQTLTIRLFEYFSSGDIRLAASCALLLMAPPLLALLMNQRLLSPATTPHMETLDE
ncbi:MAG: ABC transporter permease subunit [Rhodanobacteraceae bacterium]|nr:MAG: ABC transporter permease subunit [Rhodanobacteraceae bacterium]